MFSVKNIVILALMLALLIVSNLIAYVIPPLPNGLGSVFVVFEVMIILFSFVLGFSRTMLVGIIFYGIAAWIAPPFFIAGITYVKGIENVAGVYFLDYVIPFMILASSGVLYQKKPRYYVAIISVTIAIIVAYLSSVISGIIFWGAYAWTGWSAIAYSFGANSIRFSILLFVSDLFVIATINRLKFFAEQKLGENYAHY